MRISFNGATTIRADLATDIAAASAAGYDLIELWKSKLPAYLETHSTDDLRTALDAASLKPWSINSIEHVTFRAEEDYQAIKEECARLSAIAGSIACPYIVVVPGRLPVKGASEEEVIAESVHVLTQLADIAQPHGVGLAFEFLGQSNCSVQTLDLARKIVEKVDRPSVGLVIDSFHFYAGSSSFEAIDGLDPSKLFIFHINDSEDRPKAELTDAQRLYPGEGILPLREMKDAFDRIGYGEMVSVEIFRPEYWEQDPFEVAKKAKIATEMALGLGEYAAGGTW
nr:inosose isomerase [uncultured bacterium]